jgi:hypothetical protein
VLCLMWLENRVVCGVGIWFTFGFLLMNMRVGFYVVGFMKV